MCRECYEDAEGAVHRKAQLEWRDRVALSRVIKIYRQIKVLHLSFAVMMKGKFK